MRDILTALAGLVILVLAAALVAPPLIDWEARRATVDAALSRSLGVEARSDGRLEIRLLPSPRLRVDHLTLAEARPDRPSLDARFVKAEIALTPLLSGEIRFTETRIGRAEVKVPATEAGLPTLPAGFAASLGGRDLAVEDLRVSQLLFTTTVPATGRTDQFTAENVRLAAPRLAGPWRIEGTTGAMPFRLVTGAPTAEGALPVKVTAGGDAVPRLDIDARLTLAGDAARGLMPEAVGTARLVVGPPAQGAGAVLPVSVQGAFKARGRLATFDTVALEIDGGGAPLRLSGRGSIDLPGFRTALTLDARRLDLDAFLAGPAGQALLARGFEAAGPALPGTVAFDVAVESAAFALGEWSDIAVSATLRPSGALSLRRVEATAPGATRLSLAGDFTGPGSFAGHLAVKAPASDRFARLLDRFGYGSPLLRLLDGRPFEAEADVTAALPVLSLHNARAALGEARVSGSARYTPAGAEAPRPRLDAQVAADGLDIAELPPLRGVFDTLHDHDVGLVLRARDLRYGPTGPRTGEIAASLQSEGAALRIDSLDVRGLAGMQASLAGRIAADGSGRIAGRVTAPAAGPLLDLLEQAALAEARLLPSFLRDGPLSLDVTLERDPGAVEAGRLRSHARGSAAGGRLGLSLVTASGQIDSLEARLEGVRSGLWLGRPDDAALAQPAQMRVSGKRGSEAGAPLALTLAGDLAGARLVTTRPLALAAGEGLPRDGEVAVETQDLRPLAGFLGRNALPAAAVPARLTLGIGREVGPQETVPRLAVAGTLAGSAVEAALTFPAILRSGEGTVAGRARFDRLSLPWLASALVLDAGTGGSAPWPAGRLGPPPEIALRGSVDVETRQIDLGRGLVAEAGRFGLELGREGLILRRFSAALAGGTLAGTATLARQGGQATVSAEGTFANLALPVLTGGDAVRGRLSGRLRVGASGDSVAALVGNLAGSGEIALADLTLREVDPAAVLRALNRLLAEEDPLRSGRVEQVVAEEFGRGPLRSPGPLTVPAALVGGVLRTGTFGLDLGPSAWNGLVQVDLRTLRLDARGTFTAEETPRAWSAPPPTLGLSLAGPLARPARDLDVTPLTTVLAAVVLQRELDKIETFEADRNERARRQSRLEMDRFRAAAEAEWARLQRQRAEEEARRQAEIARAEAAAQAEAARVEARRKAEEEAARARASEPAETSQ
ncbi:MAG: hypothetical protein K2X71_03110 [Methylobacterium sp.]|uniref:hypothetical protein n=1 Tax=Methylobacterium sp. TaxID=409 RepID=UPI00258B837F|nr:hypothetical protein [Methylobacterium sp.]MBY0295018.1 hypothetical protein [Methylobacterium sp.]